MKSISIIVCAALFAVSAAGQAGQRGRSLEVQVLPAPPAPPVPPAPPLPPALMPPPPPLPPMVPEQAHTACKGKPIGAELSLSPATGVTMSGTCQKDSKGMYFELQSYNSRS